jgi:hypothetical protein
MAVAMKYAGFWDVATHGSCKNRRSRGTYRLHHQGDNNRRASKNVSRSSESSRLLVTATVVPSSPISVILMDATRSSETLDVTRNTRRKIPEDGLFKRMPS